MAGKGGSLTGNRVVVAVAIAVEVVVVVAEVNGICRAVVEPRESSESCTLLRHVCELRHKTRDSHNPNTHRVVSRTNFSLHAY